MHKQLLQYIVLGLAFIGILDAGYLTFEHYSQTVPPCSVSAWVDCGQVLKSEYATIGPMPVALMGVIFYSSLLGLILVRLSIVKSQTLGDRLWDSLSNLIRGKQMNFSQFLYNSQLLLSVLGIIFSSYFVYLQLGIIQAICLYCMLSAINSLLIFLITILERRVSE